MSTISNPPSNVNVCGSADVGKPDGAQATEKPKGLFGGFKIFAGTGEASNAMGEGSDASSQSLTNRSSGHVES